MTPNNDNTQAGASVPLVSDENVLYDTIKNANWNIKDNDLYDACKFSEALENGLVFTFTFTIKNI